MDADEGYQSLIKILNDKYDNPEARRCALHDWENLRQNNGETVKQYAQRFEEAVIFQESSGRKDLTADAKKEKFGNGLTSVAGESARAMVDPLTHLSFTQYINMVCGYARSFETSAIINSYGKASPTAQRPAPRTQLMGSEVKKEGHKDGNLSRGLGKCRRCGGKEHTEDKCWSTTIKDKERRCLICGAYDHRKVDCPNRTSKCQRCGRNGHLSSVCWAKIRSRPTTAPSKPATNKISCDSAHASEAHASEEGEPMMECKTRGEAVDSSALTLEVSNEGVQLQDGQKNRLEDFVDFNTPKIILRVGEKPQPGRTAKCVHVDALVDTGAGACFVHSTLIELLIGHNIISQDEICSIKGVLVTYANGEKANCTSAVRLPIRPKKDSSRDTKWLSCLISDTCQHTLVIGRPGMRALDMSITAIRYGDFEHYGHIPSAGSVISMIACEAIEPKILRQPQDGPTVDVDYTFESVKDSTGQARLRLRIPQIERAGIMPYSEAARPRSHTDMKILHHRFLQMEEEGKVERVPVGEAVVQLEPVLVDKYQHSGDKPREYPVDPSELKARYRVTLDMRPVNHMELAVCQEEFMWLPNASASRVKTVRPTDQKQHQSSAQELLRSIPEDKARFFAKKRLLE
ncbi:hypothetical protein Pmar_PMAR007739 [Perkinsus marinus ATCC 50983]|uniref:CCHC-type domain-containing protein n=1 Tax=Perkinsus marinus (strain ATCC 50983 / TXsc) TaxID=423536 RepID=C5K8E1_PERM5|nr:hypothetical protein Pmar_PMAR007739 [Perkinsus marinus ATCC 50983]EER19252.1 hypothetical protein Pmar_PMAR007739 [Perkinsus marinus ATCC 50983]|eukprot:XP_002787456.1 hypothetical protein Pmar_PMAR007739 [Perkinsus marinus ATCC 50983]